MQTQNDSLQPQNCPTSLPKFWGLPFAAKRETTLFGEAGGIRTPNPFTGHLPSKQADYQLSHCSILAPNQNAMVRSIPRIHGGALTSQSLRLMIYRARSPVTIPYWQLIENCPPCRLRSMVLPIGLEPMTTRLSIWCSTN